MKFYISDLHFYHTNILKMCNRPFKNIEEMKIQIDIWDKAREICLNVADGIM